MVRRLDENTGPENYLRHAFRLEVDSPKWKELEQNFISSFDAIETASTGPRRKQDRTKKLKQPDVTKLLELQDFRNEPDTDFSLRQNVVWAEEIINRWKDVHSDSRIQIPLVVADEHIYDGRSTRDCLDPSRPGTIVATYRQATEEDLAAAVSTAKQDPSGWRSMGDEQRGRLLGQVANKLRERRGDLMGAALADGGKILTESDPEVSEAIDFVEYYAASAREFGKLSSVQAEGKGVVAVVSPLNFTIAIPCGGIIAALAAGNTVILKPASTTVLVAYELCKCFWDAGVPQSALQFFPCSGGGVGSQLVSHPDVDIVILTGGTDTALRMLEAKPAMNLLAETGGKNATIVTGLSDREQAINIFCILPSIIQDKSALPPLIGIRREVYNDEEFKSCCAMPHRACAFGRLGNFIRRLVR